MIRYLKVAFLLLPFLAQEAYAACEEVASFAWALRKPGALDEYIIALDTNGNFYLEGTLYDSVTVATHLSANAVTGSEIWQVKNTSGTQLAVVYQNSTSDLYDLVIAGSLVENANFGTYSGVNDRWRISASGSALLELKEAGGGLADGSLLLACSKKENFPVGVYHEQWDSPEVGPGITPTPLKFPKHMVFVPGTNKMLVTEAGTARIRIIEDGILQNAYLYDLKLGQIDEPVKRVAAQWGLMGIACHPEFDDPTDPERYIYVYGTSEIPTPFPNDPYRPDVEAWVNNVYRFEVNAQLTPIATPAVVTGSPFGYAGNTTPTPAANPIEDLDHSGGNLRTYKEDGKNYLLLSTGCIDREIDNGLMSCRPQDVRVYPGKLLRYEIDSNGDLVIPSDNPFVPWLTETPTPLPAGTPVVPTPADRLPRGEVIASGFRNPYAFTLRPGPTPGVPIEVLIFDTGGNAERAFEEIDQVPLSFTAGGSPDDHKNFGFPRVEGNSAKPTPYPASGYEMYTGCDSGCSNNGGDLSECASFPHVEFADLDPPSVYYEHFTLGGALRGAVTGGTFITKDHFPADYKGDLFFVDHVFGTFKRIRATTLDSGTPVRLKDMADLTWFDTGDTLHMGEVIEGPDGRLYYIWVDTMGPLNERKYHIYRLSYVGGD